MRKQKEAPGKPAARQADESKVIRIAETGITRERAVAELAGNGVASNAYTMATFSKATFGDVALTDAIDVLAKSANASNAGDLSAGVALLTAQAVALNAIFGELARIGQANLFSAPEHADKYLRLAFKAQGQSRATLETLAAIKNPPVVFARQANINNGGQQQVNNGPAPTGAPASAHPGETASRPNELLEDSTHGSPTLDTRATAAAGRTNPSLEPVGAVNRPAKR